MIYAYRKPNNHRKTHIKKMQTEAEIKISEWAKKDNRKTKVTKPTGSKPSSQIRKLQSLMHNEIDIMNTFM